MRVLDGYIGRQLLLGTLMSSLVLLILLGVMNLFNELEDVGKGQYSTTAALIYTLLTLPRYAYELFPVMVLIGSLGGLGSLAANAELTAMRSAGISLGRIIGSIMRTGLLLMLAAVALGELIAPPSEQYAQQMRADLQAGQITLRSQYGFWARDGATFINIRSILPGNQLRGIFIYEFDPQGRLLHATQAEQASYGQGLWRLEGIRRTHLDETGTRIELLDQADWESILDPGLLDVVVVQPHILPIWGLYRYIHFLRDNGQQAQPYEVAFWGKLMKPLVTLAMLFLSVPFLFGSLRSVGLGRRIFVGTLIGLAFYMGNKTIAYMALVYGFNPILTALVPGLAVIGISLLAMRRVH
ncbi:MAG: LPS export ABC transporter permease LptG [Gammaproteobacteria bacterium SHHR-1]|uniref:LPS export ABC transporter permease LptG n=1 Tax=Magnetovirga frankeli TaxID=947516 RepID=UPI00129404CE|nr:LPS export ABC transporter permease LptG [gamma proteobacterium SS-5]